MFFGPPGGVSLSELLVTWLSLFLSYELPFIITFGLTLREGFRLYHDTRSVKEFERKSDLRVLPLTGHCFAFLLQILNTNDPVALWALSLACIFLTLANDRPSLIGLYVTQDRNKSSQFLQQLKFALLFTLLHLVGSVLSLLGCTYATIEQTTRALSPSYLSETLSRPEMCRVFLGFSFPMWPIVESSHEVLSGPGGFNAVIARLLINVIAVFCFAYAFANVWVYLKSKRRS